MRWLRETVIWQENPLILVAVILGGSIILGLFALFIIFLSTRTLFRPDSRTVVTAPTQIPINENLCYIVANNRSVTVYNTPSSDNPTSSSLEVNKQYVVRVIADDWYGINWPDVPAGSTGYRRFRWVSPDLSAALFRGDCDPVRRVSASMVLNELLGPGGARQSVPPANTFRPPDTDNDGVPDNIDACAGAFGPAHNRGCPVQTTTNYDTDFDGVADFRDACPNTYGVIQLDGCPGEDPRTMIGDRDSDGLDDEVDACPDRFGPAVLDGCPGEDPSTMARDTDGDGIFDAEDACPNEMGFISYDGCPSP